MSRIPVLSMTRWACLILATAALLLLFGPRPSWAACAVHNPKTPSSLVDEDDWDYWHGHRPDVASVRPQPGDMQDVGPQRAKPQCAPQVQDCRARESGSAGPEVAILAQAWLARLLLGM